MDSTLFSELVAKIPTIISFEPLTSVFWPFYAGSGTSGMSCATSEGKGHFPQPHKADTKRIEAHVFAEPQRQGKLTLNAKSLAPGSAPAKLLDDEKHDEIWLMEAATAELSDMPKSPY
jgi:hypothetical protein